MSTTKEHYGQLVEFLTPAETATELRQALKAEFPSVKFSVRTEVYAGGASINVSYPCTTGVDIDTVESVARRFENSERDPQTEIRTYYDPSPLVGHEHPVLFGVQYVFVSEDRVYSGPTKSGAEYLEEIIHPRKAVPEPADLSQFAGRKGQALREMSDAELDALYTAHGGNQRSAAKFLGYLGAGGGSCGGIADLWKTRLGKDPQGTWAQKKPARAYSGPAVTGPEALVALTTPADGELSPLATALLATLQKHRKQPLTIEALTDTLACPASPIRAAVAELRAEHYDVADFADGAAVVFAPNDMPPQESAQTPPELQTTELLIGLTSDTHWGSKFCAEDELHQVYDRFAAEGVSVVLHAGDLTAGSGTRGYRGHMWEMRDGCQGPDDLVRYTVNGYPRREGVVTQYVAGNHDEWERLASGRDLSEMISAQREDLRYLGRDTVNLGIGPEGNTRVRLMHPDGGGAYALSYKPQKFVEGLLGGTKPHLLLIGHYHRAGWFCTRNVQTIMAACFEWQTPFLARKGIEPVVGGYLLRMVLDPDGWIREFEPRFLPFYYRTEAAA